MKAKLLFTIPLYLSATLFGTPDQKDKDTRTSSLTRAEILKIFDSDGNGKLSMAERFTMRKKMQGRKKELIQKFDKDGDGKLNDEERATVRKAFEKHKSGFFEKSNTNEEEIRDQAETKASQTSDL